MSPELLLALLFGVASDCTPTPADYQRAEMEARSGGEVQPLAPGEGVRMSIALWLVAERNEWAAEKQIPWRWDHAVEAVRRYRRQADGLPPLRLVAHFPDHERVLLLLKDNRDLRDALLRKRDNEPSPDERSLMDQAIAECDRAHRLWLLADVAKSPYLVAAARREQIATLVSELGEVGLVCDMPDCVPQWAMDRWGIP